MRIGASPIGAGSDCRSASRNRIRAFRFRGARFHRAGTQPLRSIVCAASIRYWIDNGTRHTATYTNLPAGRLRLRRARQQCTTAIWNETPATCILVVAPPWWASTRGAATSISSPRSAGAVLWWPIVHRRRQQLARQHRELREREDRLRLALWGSGDEFWDWDMRNVVSIVTDSASCCALRKTLSRLRRRRGSRKTSIRTICRSSNSASTNTSPAAAKSSRSTSPASSRRRLDLGAGARAQSSSATKTASRCACAAPRATSWRARWPIANAASRQEVIDSMNEAVSVTDLDFNFVAVNPRIHAHVRLSGNRGADAAGVASCSIPRSIRRNIIYGDAPVAPRQRPLARRAVAAAQERRGIPVLDRAQRSARRGRRAHAFRRRDSTTSPNANVPSRNCAISPTTTR